MIFTGFNVLGNIVVTPASSVTCVDVAPGSFTTLSNIVLTEGLKGDFPTQVLKTFILTAPTGFEFNPGVGTITPTTPGPNGNIVTASVTMSVTSSTITITFSVSGTNKFDDMTIGGIQVRATSYGVTGNILRLAGAAGGTATATGDAAGGGINHGTLTSEPSSSIYTIANGNWTNPAIWSSGVIPTCIDTVFIRHTVSADAIQTVRHMVIETNGILTTDFAVTVDSSFHITGTGIYIHNNLTDASTTIFKATENFGTTSTIIIQRWYNTAVAFPNNVTGNFGNITFIQGASWGQQGLFAPARIKGTLTVSSGIITMDEGTGLTTSLTLNDVVVNSTGALIMATGAARNLTLVTGNYTDTSTSATRSTMMLTSQGNLTWTANGNVAISHSWSGYEHSGSNTGNTSITINGNLTISGGSFDINKSVNAPLNLVVTGNTTFSGTPNYIHFIDSNSGALTFSTNNFYITGGDSTELMGGNSPTGNAQITVTNDFALSGAGTVAAFYNNTATTASTTFTTGRDLTVTDGELKISNTNGALAVTAGRNITVTGAAAMLRGQIYATSTGAVTINVTGTFDITTGTARISEGTGSITITIVENLVLNNGTFHGIYNTVAANNGVATLTCDNINFTGGTFSFFTADASDGKTIQVNCSTDINVTFLSATDVFVIIPRAGTNNAVLDLNVAYNITIGGNFPGSYFLSSASSGVETVDIGGTFTVNAGDVYFVGNEGALANNHNITTNITGDLIITGGNTRLSTGAGSATVNVSGDVNVSGGTLSLKYSTGVATMTITGNYSQSNGTFYIHSGIATTTDASTVIINGDFSFTDGTLNFENFAASSGLAEHSIYINGANYTIGGSAIITHANNLTTNFIFGQIYFNRTGTTTYSRTSTTNNIKHVKYTINASTTVDASASTEGFQMTSVQSNNPTNHNSLNVYGVIDMGDKVLSARQQNNYYSRVTVRDNGRYRTSHTGGLYSGVSGVPSSINGFMIAANRVNYTLELNSTVEYYGTSTSIVTGIPNGAASTNSQKYGILEINFTGAAGSTWVYPETADEVFVRTSLILTEGEFNLDDDHVTTNGGRPINLENGATMSRSNGFIRSETEDGSGLVRWNITANGSYIFHFGYDAATYIPFTHQQTAGSSGTISLGTYRSAADNTPYPPTVTHTRDVVGNENSGFTVDRFWYIDVPGGATADLTFTYAPTEGSGIVSPRAQLWEPVSTGWFPPVALQTNPTAITTNAPGITGFNNWWTLSAASSPLPIELLSFDVTKKEKKSELKWVTASETENDYFTVERSRNGITFEPVGNVDGAGNSNSTLVYNFTDQSPENGTNYYRIKQTDFDGRSSYSNTRYVVFNTNNYIEIYPSLLNVDDELTVNVNEPGEYKIELYENTGKLIFSKTEPAGEIHTFKIRFPQSQITAGLYYCIITGPSGKFTQKIFIK